MVVGLPGLEPGTFGPPVRSPGFRRSSLTSVAAGTPWLATTRPPVWSGRGPCYPSCPARRVSRGLVGREISVGISCKDTEFSANLFGEGTLPLTKGFSSWRQIGQTRLPLLLPVAPSGANVLIIKTH